MRLLFEIDAKNYDSKKNVFVRPSVRSIIIKNGKVGMLYSTKYHYYSFPGGGVEPGENKIDALIRETLEETGLKIITLTIEEYGYAQVIKKGKIDDVFIQDNYYYYYIVEVYDECYNQNLIDYEIDEEFELQFVDPIYAINTNNNSNHSGNRKYAIMRDSKVLEILINER